MGKLRENTQALREDIQELRENKPELRENIHIKQLLK